MSISRTFKNEFTDLIEATRKNVDSQSRITILKNTYNGAMTQPIPETIKELIESNSFDDYQKMEIEDKFYDLGEYAAINHANTILQNELKKERDNQERIYLITNCIDDIEL